MAVLFEEVVLGDEDVVIPELIGELDLLQRFVVYLEFVLVVPLVGVEWFGRLQLEINAKFHALLSLLKVHVSTRGPELPWICICATYTCNRVRCQSGVRYWAILWVRSYQDCDTIYCHVLLTKTQAHEYEKAAIA